MNRRDTAFDAVPAVSGALFFLLWIGGIIAGTISAGQLVASPVCMAASLLVGSKFGWKMAVAHG